MKIQECTYQEVLKKKQSLHLTPLKPSKIFRLLARIWSEIELNKVSFHADVSEDFKILNKNKKQPILFLMNHATFLDLNIGCKILGKRQYNILTTQDAFIGRKLFMQLNGCIATKKFYSETSVVKDILYSVRKLKSSVIMFPDASFSLVGTLAAPIPESLGKLVKLLKIPLVTIISHGAYLHHPLYNEFLTRKIPVSASVKVLLNENQIKEYTLEKINSLIKNEFSFNEFKWQAENKIPITEKNRCKSLERILYKCPHCLKEGQMLGNENYIICKNCSVKYELNQFGLLQNNSSKSIFTNIPDWFKWERKSVKEEILNKTYNESFKVKIMVMVNLKKLYQIGQGQLVHDMNGFKLRLAVFH